MSYEQVCTLFDDLNEVPEPSPSGSLPCRLQDLCVLTGQLLNRPLDLHNWSLQDVETFFDSDGIDLPVGSSPSAEPAAGLTSGSPPPHHRNKLWRVVHNPRVAVRREKSVESELVHLAAPRVRSD